MSPEALDLSRQRWARRYREPDDGFGAPYANIPPPGPADLQVVEPLDLSIAPPRPAVEGDGHAGGPGEADQVQPMSPVQPSQINSLGFRERYDFQDLYGFQSYGGSRLSRTVAGLELNRNSSGIGQMIEGDILRTYTTIEAAEEAARRTPLQHYRLIHIRAEGLRAVSFQDNRLNNPLFESLRLPLTQIADHVTQPRLRTALRNQLMRDAEQEVHLSTESLSRDRIRLFSRGH